VSTNRTSKWFGCLPDLKDPRDEAFLFSTISKPVVLPPKSDNRSLNCPVWDQGNEGSCTGFGTNDAVEQWLLKNHKDEFVHLSAKFTYFNGRLVEGTTDQDSGAMIRDVVKATAKYGLVADIDFPYVAGDYADVPNKSVYANGKRHIVKSFHRVRGIEQIRQAIAQGYSVVGGWTLYDNFMRVGSDGILGWPSANDSIAGGHCMKIEDYDDTEQLSGSTTGVITALNSWSKTWGDQGRVHMSYDYCEKCGNDFWALVLISGF
jgi:C1A family cysteine protease